MLFRSWLLVKSHSQSLSVWKQATAARCSVGSMCIAWKCALSGEVVFTGSRVKVYTLLELQPVTAKDSQLRILQTLAEVISTNVRKVG